MKLLFDQNISFRAVNKRKVAFPDCAQVRELKLENKSDREIWSFAKKEDYTIVTFDVDFYDLVTLYGHPPKIVWLRIGNTSTDHLIMVFQNHSELIKTFVNTTEYAEMGCPEIS